ncbi:FtsX-like permease family protein [Ruminococcus sp. OA3]|uniref:FtsX-like permease family protein n=1 Tax=Ruminococcus sp. OA3 TaxID=2914164 RepID=UPI001F068C08|nr:FtsX-like permease family protein [Ruminococcus sp. OA3]MCH1983370.1 FtsX-like permease family protein [Ruminococcus sp. OA3]
MRSEEGKKSAENSIRGSWMCWLFWEVMDLMADKMIRTLSLRNAKRQATDYTIYIITMIISVAVLYTINATVTSENLDIFGGMSSTFMALLYILDLIVILIVGWLVNYMMRFMLEKRSREFGMYFLMGMESSQVSGMFLKENFFIGAMSLVAGVFAGGILYQLIQSLIMHIFELDFSFSITFSARALLLTITCYLIILLFAAFRSRRKLKKVEIHSLLYLDQANEETILNAPWKNRFLFLCSILCLLTGVAVIYCGFGLDRMDAMTAVLIALISFGLGIFTFYHCAGAFFAWLLTHNKDWKYKGQRMFLVRMLTSKINTISTTLSVIAILFTLAIICMSEGVLLKDVSEKNVTDTISFDIQATAERKKVIDQVEDAIRDTQKVAGVWTYQLYETAETKLYRVITNRELNSGRLYETDYVMKLSDYNELRKMKGLETQALEDDELLIHCRNIVSEDFKKHFIRQQETIDLGAVTYRCKAVYDEAFSQYWFNGMTYLIVLPDEAACLLEPEDHYKCVSEINGRVNDDLKNILADEMGVRFSEDLSFSAILSSELSVDIQQYSMLEQRKGNVLFSFPIFYIAFVLVIAAATVLSVQQLSDIAKYRRRYCTMEQLGLDTDKKEKTIFIQVLLFFMMPAVLPAFISGYAIIGTGTIYATGMQAAWIMKVYLLVLAAFLVIHTIYFLASYLQFRKMIDE